MQVALCSLAVREVDAPSQTVDLGALSSRLSRSIIIIIIIM